MQTVNKENLKSIIESSFRRSTREKPVQISSGPYPPIKEDPKEIHELFFNKNWFDLSSDFFLNDGAIQSGIGFMTNEAFLYYLPAMMLFILGEDFNLNSACMIDIVMERLNVLMEMDHHAARNIFGEDEKNTIELFKQYIEENAERFFLS